MKTRQYHNEVRKNIIPNSFMHIMEKKHLFSTINNIFFLLIIFIILKKIQIIINTHQMLSLLLYK